MHSHLFVDGLDLVARSDSRACGLHPRLLLRPGGPLYPADMPREVAVAESGRSGTGVDVLTITVRLRGDTVVWSGLMYPDLGHGVVEEARFGLAQYLGEVERVYAAWSGSGEPGAASAANVAGTAGTAGTAGAADEPRTAR